jgi:archaellum component FlaC
MAEPSLELLQNLILRSLDGQADLKREMGDVRSLTLALSDKVQRLDDKIDRLERSIQDVKRDMHDMKDDLWIMLKSEIMGRQGNFETRVEFRLANIEDRLPPR